MPLTALSLISSATFQRPTWKSGFLYAVSDALKLLLLEDSKYYTVQTANRMEKYLSATSCTFKGEGKNAVITTFHGTILVRKSLLTVYEELNAEEFLFIERGCIVNLIHISQIQEQQRPTEQRHNTVDQPLSSAGSKAGCQFLLG